MGSSHVMDGSSKPQAPDRNLAIDRLRGLLVIMMVIGDYLGGIAWVPDFLKHAPDIGFTIADTVAPAFVFVIGLNFGPSFERHMSEGSLAAYRYFLLRYLSLIGIGAIIAAGSDLVGKPVGWGVLQALGVAGLITLAVIRFPSWARFVIGLLVLIGYQFLLDASMLQSVLGSSHGGMFGAISWAALLILSTAMADVWRSGRKLYLIGIALLLMVSAAAAFIVPVSKNRVSLSYILATLAISAVVFLLFELALVALDKKSGILCWWGENALALYVTHLLVLALVVAPGIDWWYASVPIWLAALQLIVILGFMSLVARWIHRRWPA